MTKSLRFILIGKNGLEKSETGDTILNRKGSFQESTRSCELVCTDRGEHELCVLNTPDFSQEPFEERNLEIMKCIYMSAPGPHAIILVVPFGQLDEQYVEEMEDYIAVIGETLFNFLIVVFTHPGYDVGTKVKYIDKGNMNMDDYVNSLTEKVKEFVDKCHGVIGFDNALALGDLEKKVAELISLVPDIESDKPNFFYHEAYESAELAVQEDILKAMEKIENQNLQQDTKKELENIESKNTYQQEDSNDEIEDSRGNGIIKDNEEELEDFQGGDTKSDPSNDLMPRTVVKKSNANERPKQSTQNTTIHGSYVSQTHTSPITSIDATMSDTIRKKSQQSPDELRTQIQFANTFARFCLLGLKLLQIVQKRFPK